MSWRLAAVLCALVAAACAPGVNQDTDAEPERPISDASPLPADSAVPSDAPPMAGTGLYLDRCFVPGDCASLHCIEDLGGTLFCSRGCSSHSECALEHVCSASGVCVPDNTGALCTPAMPSACALGLCVPDGAGGGACARDCGNAADCPAGYACTRVGGIDAKVCVDIEKPCDTPDDCEAGICLPEIGCTGTCDTAADCPERLPGFTPYQCGPAAGSSSPICAPPEDVVGPDPIGARCRWAEGSGASLCRSAACDDGAPVSPMCTQACTAQGGCGPGLGCFPLSDGGVFKLACTRAGTGDLGDGCDAGEECFSGLCDATGGYCTRLCHDGVCPTGWSCQKIAGSDISMCRK